MKIIKNIMENNTEYYEKGLIGLVNRGNTCFLNTTLQMLSNIPPLTEYFIEKNFDDDLMNRLSEEKHKENPDRRAVNYIILSKEYAKLITALWTNSGAIEPRSFHQCIQTFEPTFRGFSQQDAQEVMTYILDALHEGLYYEVKINYSGEIENNVDRLMVESIKHWKNSFEKKYSTIVELFYGQFYVKKISDDDNFKKNEIIETMYENFNLLNLPINGHTLYDCLDSFFSIEKIDDPVQVEGYTERLHIKREFKIIRIPKYFIIVLKRFKENNGFFKKMNNPITFPFMSLDISQYCIGYDKTGSIMDLKCIGLHTGSLQGGHYFAYCKHINGKWYEYNDSSCNEINIEKERRQGLFQNAYILIYEKTINS